MNINGVEFDDVIKDAIKAATVVFSEGADNLVDIVKNIGDSLVCDIEFVAKKKLSGEFEEVDARVFLEDQKVVARMRLRSLAIITMKIAEDIWNAIVHVFNSAINQALGWTLL